MTKLKVGVRYFLGVVFILYSLVKFFRRHPYDFPISGDIHSIPSDRLFWYFFGYSQAYVNYLGFIELASGILILFPKTFRIGALSLTVMAANIAILDFVYNVGPVKFWATFLAILSFGLMATEWSSYRTALQSLIERSEK